MTARWWRRLVGAAIAVGLAIRIGSVLARPHLVAFGDPAEYLGQANLLVSGKGWVEPYVYAQTGHLAQTAKLPPLYTALMALCSLVGLKSFFAHRIWSAILSTAGVWLAAALGRRLAGRTVGVLAAFGVAVYPNMWLSAGLGMSETISPLLVMAVLLAAYWTWESPGWRRAALLGASIGFAALARDELLVLLALVLAPVCLRSGWAEWRRRLQVLAVGVVAALVVISPWVTFNLVRFDHPIFISDRFGATLAAANCPESYYGSFTGYWSMPCAVAAVAGVHGDESADDPVATSRALGYIGGHLSRLPFVEFARLGRTFGFYRIHQQMLFDTFIEGRPRLWAWTGLWSFYLLAATAPFGVWALRRHGVPIFPLVAVLADVVLVVVVTYGQTRFRATLEPVLVLGSAVALARVSGARQHPHRVERGAVPGESGRSFEGGPLQAMPQEGIAEH